jgi:GPI ethanolamine phosphate transferase 2/3 subunit F
MAKRKAKPQVAGTAHGADKSYIAAKPGFFPFSRYISIVGVHTNLLAFTALYLPRTAFFIITPDLTPASSRDKPQHPFLDPLTINPAWTLASICGGAIILQGWWGGWVRNWSIESTLTGSNEEKRLGRSMLDRRKSVVSFPDRIV